MREGVYFALVGLDEGRVPPTMRAVVLACLAAATAASRAGSLHAAPLATRRARHERQSELLGGPSGGATRVATAADQSPCRP